MQQDADRIVVADVELVPTDVEELDAAGIDRRDFDFVAVAMLCLELGVGRLGPTTGLDGKRDDDGASRAQVAPGCLVVHVPPRSGGLSECLHRGGGWGLSLSHLPAVRSPRPMRPRRATKTSSSPSAAAPARCSRRSEPTRAPRVSSPSIRETEARYGVQVEGPFCTVIGIWTCPASCFPLSARACPWNCRRCGPFKSMRVSRLTVRNWVASWNSKTSTPSIRRTQWATVLGPALVTRPVTGTIPCNGASMSGCTL